MDTSTFITVIFMWMLLVFGALAVFMGYRHRRAALDLLHAERMSAIERGLDPPSFAAPVAGNEHLHRGLVCILVGAALMVPLALDVGWPSAAWALPLIGYGIACLILHRLAHAGRATE